MMFPLQKKWRCTGDRIARVFNTDPTEPIGSQRVTMCRAVVIAILFPSDHRTPIHFIGFHEHNLRIGSGGSNLFDLVIGERTDEAQIPD